MKMSLVVLVTLFLSTESALAEEPVDLDMITKIRDEGFNRSEVMESVRVLADEIGPRLTASPGMRATSKWSVEKLKAMGLKNVRLEGFDFGHVCPTTIRYPGIHVIDTAGNVIDYYLHTARDRL